MVFRLNLRARTMPTIATDHGHARTLYRSIDARSHRNSDVRLRRGGGIGGIMTPSPAISTRSPFCWKSLTTVALCSDWTSVHLIGANGSSNHVSRRTVLTGRPHDADGLAVKVAMASRAPSVNGRYALLDSGVA